MMRSLLVLSLIALSNLNIIGQKDSLDLDRYFLTTFTLKYQARSEPERATFTKTQSSLNTYLDVRKPFFCRMESRWEKRSGQALKFRLGSVEVVDRYEGKDDRWSIH